MSFSGNEMDRSCSSIGNQRPAIRRWCARPEQVIGGRLLARRRIRGVPAGFLEILRQVPETRKLRRGNVQKSKVLFSELLAPRYTHGQLRAAVRAEDVRLHKG